MFKKTRDILRQYDVVLDEEMSGEHDEKEITLRAVFVVGRLEIFGPSENFRATALDIP